MIKKIILWTIILICVILAVVSYLGYRSFNTEAFKQHIANTIQELTGRTFVVNGPYTLAWDPLPTMTMENVALSNIENSDNPDMFKADEVQIQIEWASLFSSPTRIKNILIVNPIVVIERIGHSVTNINFPQLFVPPEAMASDVLLGEQQPQALIDNIHIENGTLRYINKMWKQDYTVNKLTGEFVFGSPSGPFKFNGHGMIQEIPCEINTYFSNLEQAKPLPFFVELTIPDSDSYIKLEGNLFPGDIEKYLTGSLSIETKKTNALLKQLNLPQLPPAYNENLIGNADVIINAQNTTLSNAVLKIDDNNNPFVVNFTYGRENVSQKGQLKMELSTLNLDHWYDTLHTAFHDKLLPSAALNFDINMAHIIWNDKTATTLQLVGVADSKQIQVNKGSVLLPGSTTVQMSGHITPAHTGQIKIDLQSQNFPQALAFFKWPKSFLIKQLQKTKKAELSSTLDWTQDTLKLSAPAFLLNQTTGSLNYTQNATAPSTINLTLNNLNLNEYLSQTDMPKTISAFQKKLFNFLSSPVSLPNTQLNLTAQNVSYQDLGLQNLKASMTKSNNTIDMDISAQFDKKDSVKLNTQIQDIGTEQWHLTRNDFQINLSDLQDLLKRLKINATQNKLTQTTQDLNLSGNILGRPNQWQLDLIYQTHPYRLTLQGAMINQKPQNLTLQLRHKSAPHLWVDLFDKKPLLSLDGEFSLDTKLTHQDQTLYFNELTAQVNDQSFTGNVSYVPDKTEIYVTLTSPKIDLAKFLPNLDRLYFNGSRFDETPFDLSSFKQVTGTLDLRADSLIYQPATLNNAIFKARLENNQLSIDEFRATTAQEQASNLNAQGSFNFANIPLLKLDLSTQNFPITYSLGLFNGKGLSGGLLSSDAHLSTSGASSLDLARNLSGNGHITLQNPTWNGINVSALSGIIETVHNNETNETEFEENLRNTLSIGSTPILALDGDFQISKGTWQIPQGLLKVDAENVQNVNVTWDIPQDTLRANIPFKITQYPDLPDISLTYSKEAQDVSYTPDVSAFVTALFKQVQKNKQDQKKATEEQQAQEHLQQLDDAKEQATQNIQQIQEQLNLLTQQLNQTPDIHAQQGVQNATTIINNLKPLMEKSDLSLQEYRDIIKQTETAQENLTTAQHLLLGQTLQTIRASANNIFDEAQGMIEKMDGMQRHQPHQALLADLVQNSKNQRDIISRALSQFDKNLSYTQVQRVFTIIQEAGNKIKKAYEYAQKLFDKPLETSRENTIKRVAP